MSGKKKYSCDCVDNFNIWCECNKIKLDCWKERCGVFRNSEECCEYSQLTPKSNKEDTSVIISPKGDGFIATTIPDGTRNGGNCRGKNAVDFQKIRTNADQVASGDFSVILAGKNNNSTGDYSVSSGLNCSTNGDFSKAFGENSKTFGEHAYSRGKNVNSTAKFSSATGENCSGIGDFAYAGGESTQAIGEHAFSYGKNSVANGKFSGTTGENCIADGDFARSSGLNCISGGDFSAAYGKDINASAPFSNAVGEFCQSTEDYSYSNGVNCYASGLASRATGFGFSEMSIKAEDIASFAHGFTLGEEESHIARGNGSVVLGRDMRSNLSNSVSLGQHADSKIQSNGGNIQGVGSLQIGGGSSANDRKIMVMIGTQIYGEAGQGGGASSFWQTGGADYSEFFEWVDGNENNEDRVGYFVCLDKDNAEKIKMAGHDNDVIGITTSLNAEIGIVGDSAELGWANVAEKDPLGRTYYYYSFEKPLEEFLLKNKIEITPNVRDIIKKTITDKISYETIDTKTHLNKILEESIKTLKNTELKIKNFKIIDSEEKEELFKKAINILATKNAVRNKDYDPDKTYIPRSVRKEWAPVSLLGKVRVRDNGLCQPGQKCSCENGIAVPGEKWRVLKRISDDVIRILLI